MSAAYAETIPAAQPFASARAYGEELERTLSGDGMLRAEHSEVELLVAKSGREWARLMLEAQFSMRADLEKFVEVVGADGAERTRAKDSERHHNPAAALRRRHLAASCPWERIARAYLRGAARTGSLFVSTLLPVDHRNRRRWITSRAAPK